MPDPNTRLTIRMSQPSCQDNQRTMRIDVEDVSTHLLIASLELKPEHVMQLLGNQQVGSVDGVPAFLIPAEMREHLGKTNVHVARSLPSYPPRDSRFGNRTGAADELLTRWGFTRTTANQETGLTRYVATSGVFAVRVHITAERTATLELGLREPGRALYRPWSVSLPQQPWPLAVEAVAFLRVLNGD